MSIVKRRITRSFKAKENINKIALGDFNVGKLLGQGGFGKVHLCKRKNTNQLLCIKIIEKSIERAKTEAKIMSKFKHPFVMNSQCSFEHANSFCIVMPLVNGGDLEALMKKNSFSEQDARFYAAELVSAIGYIHSLNIVHRDIKPSNILISGSGHLLLCDFGLAAENMPFGVSTTEKCGTLLFKAPELLNGFYNRSDDWWALGIVLAKMIFRRYPFYTKEAISSNLPNFVGKASSSSRRVRNFLHRLLEKDPTKRLGGGPRDCEEVKEHLFLSILDWSSLSSMAPPYIPREPR